MSQLVRALSGRRRAQRRSAYDAATRAPVPPSADASAAAETFLFQLSPAALRGAPAGVRRVALSLYSAAGDLLQATPSREVRARARGRRRAGGAACACAREHGKVPGRSSARRGPGGGGGRSFTCMDESMLMRLILEGRERERSARKRHKRVSVVSE